MKLAFIFVVVVVITTTVACARVKRNPDTSTTDQESGTTTTTELPWYWDFGHRKPTRGPVVIVTDETGNVIEPTAPPFNFMISISDAEKYASRTNAKKMVIDATVTSAEPLPNFDALEITEVEIIETSTIHYSTLVQFLTPLTNLESLVMHNASFREDFEQRVKFPHLRNFFLDQYCNFPDFYYIGILEIDRPFFKNLLFFDIEDTTWEFDELFGLNVNVKFILGGKISIFELSHENKIYDSLLEFINRPILESVPDSFTFETMKLRHRGPFRSMTVSTNWIPSGVKNLTLAGASRVEDGDMSSVLARTRELIYLKYYIFAYNPPIHFTEFSPSIEKLIVNYQPFVYTPGARLNLDTFDCTLCHFEPQAMLENFGDVINTKNLMMIFSDDDYEAAYTIVANGLKNPALEYIAAIGVNREASNATHYDEVEEAFDSFGVEKDESRIRLRREEGKWVEKRRPPIKWF